MSELRKVKKVGGTYVSAYQLARVWAQPPIVSIGKWSVNASTVAGAFVPIGFDLTQEEAEKMAADVAAMMEEAAS